MLDVITPRAGSSVGRTTSDPKPADDKLTIVNPFFTDLMSSEQQMNRAGAASPSAQRGEVSIPVDFSADNDFDQMDENAWLSPRAAHDAGPCLDDRFVGIMSSLHKTRDDKLNCDDFISMLADLRDFMQKACGALSSTRIPLTLGASFRASPVSLLLRFILGTEVFLG